MLKKAQRKNSSRKCSNDHDSFQKPHPKPLPQPQNIKFNKSDIVWAKITGYPWWPAIVTTAPGEKDPFRKEDENKNRRPLQKFNSMSRGEYRVDFIADQTHAFLKKKFLLTFRSNRDKLYQQGLQFSRRKRRFFQMAINQADQLYQVLQLSKQQITHPPKIQKKNLDEKLISSQSESSERKSQVAQNDSQEEESLPQQKGNENQNQQVQSESEEKVQIKKGKPLMRRGRKSRKANIKNRCRINSETLKNQQQFSILPPTNNKQQINSANKRISKMTFIKTKSFQERLIKKNKTDQKPQHVTEQGSFLKEKQIFYEDDKQSMQPIIEEQEKNISSIPHYDCQAVESSRAKDIQKDLSQLLQPNETLTISLLQKYKLHTIDEVQAEYKKQLEASISLNTYSNIKLKGSKSTAFIKNIFSTFGRRKFSKKQDPQSEEARIFTQTIFSLNKLKESNLQNINPQRKTFLIQYCRKWTARKLYNIVQGILKNNNVFNFQHKILHSIRQRCINISSLIFSTQDHAESQRNHLNQQNKKKGNHNFETLHFVISLKKKIEQSVKFIRLWCLQNWGLLVRAGHFIPQICIQVKSFEQFLQRQCGLIMKNEQKLAEVVKQIGIQNDKTQFTCGHQTAQMEVQNQSPNHLPSKFYHEKPEEFHDKLTDSKQKYVELN